MGNANNIEHTRSNHVCPNPFKIPLHLRQSGALIANERAQSTIGRVLRKSVVRVNGVLSVNIEPHKHLDMPYK